MTRLREILVGLVLVGLGLGIGSSGGTLSAFAGTSSNAGNSVTAGDVKLADDDANVPMFTVSAARPGPQPPRCIVVRNAGSLPSRVRLYATVSGQLAPHLTLKVTRGTATSPTAGSCATFQPDADGGARFDGRLDTFPTTAAAALVEPADWAPGEAHAYRFELTLEADAAGQGHTADVSFTWEGRSA